MERLVQKRCACGCGLTWRAYKTSKSKYYGEDHKAANLKRALEKPKERSKDYIYATKVKNKEHLRQSLGESFLYA
jgi:hypothetical protein